MPQEKVPKQHLLAIAAEEPGDDLHWEEHMCILRLHKRCSLQAKYAHRALPKGGVVEPQVHAKADGNNTQELPKPEVDVRGMAHRNRTDKQHIRQGLQLLKQPLAGGPPP